MPATNTVSNPEDIFSVVLPDIPLAAPLVTMDGGRELYKISTSSANNCIDTETLEIVSVNLADRVFFAEVETIGGANVFTRVNPPAPPAA